MENQEKKDEKRKMQQTPIIDGDARPDIDLHPEDKLKRDHPIPTPADREKTTTNRNDSNSLEDFRDAK